MDAVGQITGRHRKNHAANSACPAANAPATCHSRARGTRIASQKNTGNSTDVKRPTEMNRCAATGGKTLTAIQTPYATPNRRVTRRLAAPATANDAMSPRYTIASVIATGGAPGSRPGSGAGG